LLSLLNTSAKHNAIVNGKANFIAGNGIVWNFLRPTHVRLTLANNGGNAIVYRNTYSSVVGALSNARLLLRNKGQWDSTTPNTKSNVGYVVFTGVSYFI